MKRLALMVAMLLALAPSPAAAERILALTPHACEILFAIGAGSDVVGAVDYCDYPKASRLLPRVGSYAGINVEAALRLRPDMAIVMNEQVPGVDRLRALGVRVLASNPENLEEVFADIQRIGEAVGRGSAAARLVRGLRTRFVRLRRERARPPVRAFYELWGSPLMTAGGRSFITDLMRDAGLDNVFAGTSAETVRVNVESVLRAHPSLIIVPLEHRSLAARRAFWRRWLPKARVVGVNPDLLHRPGPRLLDGLEALVHAAEGARR